MSREPELADIPLEDLGLTIQDCEQFGFAVRECWDTRPGVSRADAHSVMSKQQRAHVDNEEAHYARQNGQRQWLLDRAQTCREVYAETLAGRGSPMANEEARQAGLRAMLKFEKRRPPETWGFPSSIRTSADVVEYSAPTGVH